MRHALGGGLRRTLPLGGLLLAALLLGAGCESEPEVPLDGVLQDSLGLGPDARVRTVEVGHSEGSETADPDSIRIQVGEWLDFRTLDAHPRVIRFELDSMTPEARAFLVQARAEASPPLVRPEVHWALPTDSAPPGRYPYRIEGSGTPGRGLVVVVAPVR